MAKLYFRYASMNAGKSTYALQVAHNYEEQGQSVRMFTAAMDDRYGMGKIASRLGIQRDAECFDPEFNFEQALSASQQIVACLIVDEAQFLTPTQVRQLHRVAALQGIPVLCYGLRSDFLGEPFPGAACLLTLADSIEEMKSICTCGRKATMNLRVDAQGRPVTHGAQVEIGGNDRYRQMCAKCFYTALDTSKFI
ncbi:thymidine kinase [Burkholderiaceae bacterium DAT-1]|nr:thymidine kinase [Burkholderiaceae bacterium DAT-1]